LPWVRCRKRKELGRRQRHWLQQNWLNLPLRWQSPLRPMQIQPLPLLHQLPYLLLQWQSPLAS
jgi:hypothetical protein